MFKLVCQLLWLRVRDRWHRRGGRAYASTIHLTIRTRPGRIGCRRVEIYFDRIVGNLIHRAGRISGDVSTEDIVEIIRQGREERGNHILAVLDRGSTTRRPR